MRNVSAGDIRIVNLEPEDQKSYLILGALLPDNSIAGFLCCGMDGGACMIRYIYVAGALRRRGIATRLLQRLVGVFLAKEGGRRPLEACFMEDEEHSDVKCFFEAQNNFVLERIDAAYRYSGSYRRTSLRWKQLLERSRDGMPFFSLSRRERNRFFMEQGMEGLSDLPCDERLCFGAVGARGIEGAVFADILSGGTLYISGAAGSISGIGAALGAFAEYADRNYEGSDILTAIEGQGVDHVITILGRSVSPERALVVRWNYLSAEDSAAYRYPKPELD